MIFEEKETNLRASIINDKVRNCSRILVKQSTINRNMRRQFVYYFVKYDLAYYYKQCNDRVEKVKRKGWKILNNKSNNITSKEEL